MTEPARIIHNRAQCRKCGDVVESEYRHDSKSCRCGAIYVDGGRDYLRRGASDLNDIIELSESEMVEERWWKNEDNAIPPHGP